MPDTISPRPVTAHPSTAGEAAVWYAAALGWPVTPGYEWASDSGACRCDDAANCASVGVHPVPGPWQWAASAAPTLVHAVWQACPSAPVLAVLGRPVPGAVRLGVLDVPVLVGVAALERLGKLPAAAGPITDGQGRIRFLVDLGEESEHYYSLEKWRSAGVDIRTGGSGIYCPLPTPGAVGPQAVVWTVPPDPDRRSLPHAKHVAAILDRAVRDAYPALWNASIP
jgi:hypothetical protein